TAVSTVPCAVKSSVVTSAPCCCSARSSASPSMRGVTRSEITIAGRKDVTFCRASSPSVAESATKPQLLTSCSRPTRAAESSSTINTRSATDFRVESINGAVSPAVVIVKHHLNHVIFTFSAPFGRFASSTETKICRTSSRGEAFAPAQPYEEATTYATPDHRDVLVHAGHCGVRARRDDSGRGGAGRARGHSDGYDRRG